MRRPAAHHQQHRSLKMLLLFFFKKRIVVFENTYAFVQEKEMAFYLNPLLERRGEQRGYCRIIERPLTGEGGGELH